MCAEPNGRNINLNCGALHTGRLREAVLESGADAGVAFDGDADRAMLISPHGHVVDGDSVMLIAARRLQRDGATSREILWSRPSAVEPWGPSRRWAGWA